MYIKVAGKNIPLTISHNKCIEQFILGSDNKWIRDDAGALHVSKRHNKYTIIIKCHGIVAPYIANEYIGALCEIESQTRLFEYIENGNFCRKYQDGSLGKHVQQESLRAIKTYDTVIDPKDDGIYSYMPIIEAYLRSIDIINDDKGIHWNMIFEEK